MSLEVSLQFAPFPFSWCNLRNGPERSRARGVCAAKRTLDGEDRSGTWVERERGLDRCIRRDQLRTSIRLVAMQHGPRDPHQFVGQRDNRHVLVRAGHQLS